MEGKVEKERRGEKGMEEEGNGKAGQGKIITYIELQAIIQNETYICTYTQFEFLLI